MFQTQNWQNNPSSGACNMSGQEISFNPIKRDFLKIAKVISRKNGQCFMITKIPKIIPKLKLP